MKSQHIAALALLGAILAGGAYSLTHTQLHARGKLIVLAGQSNAAGQESDASLLPRDGIDAPFWWDEPSIGNGGMKWVRLSPQPSHIPAGHFGPEYGIAAQIPDAAIFKFTSGATSLANDWRPGARSGLMERFSDELSLAMSQTDAEPYCFVFVQGESDAETKEMAGAYGERLKSLVGIVRSRMGPDVKIVLSVDELHPWIAANPEVVDAQKNFEEADPKIRFSSFRDLPKADSTHLVAAGTLEQGKRFAETCKDIP